MMSNDQIEQKAQLDVSQAHEVERAFETADAELLGAEEQPARANVVGYAAGVKWTNGQPTGEPALLALVTHKLPREAVPASELVPTQVNGMQTDVLAVGVPFAGADAATLTPTRRPSRFLDTDGLSTVVRGEATEQLSSMEVGALTLARRLRPAKGGYSVGHFQITAGTIATGVYDILPGGVGIPSRYYILSNNHVLANSNAGSIGDPILQPGPFDGGVNPTDRIGRLNRFIPITFSPPVPLFLHNNLVDAAVAEVEFHDLDRLIHWTGPVTAWRRKTSVNVGMLVQKTGRTTNLTFGRITAINATIDVNFGGGRVARFRDQIVTTNMSAGGDSGSLVCSRSDNMAVGLLFAGSSVATIVNQIENVRSLLRVEVAERAV